ncbi:MAG TPA: crosslink repair DNA glycosylase YcaQ family protein, partial [Burkholderiaceae bacterium]|nr:crosslink repair DNA glycosylase YcaQ family protein [Burkholderiaceae bacterium]
PASAPEVPNRAWLLAPFDPLVWDRRRFERFWGWAYRFEAYTPAPKRRLGHYALPLLWREQVVGWANVSVDAGVMRPEVGFVGPRIADPAFVRAVDDELHRMHAFLGLAPLGQAPATACAA